MSLPITEYYFIEIDFGLESILRYTSKQSVTIFNGNQFRPVEGVFVQLPPNTVAADSDAGAIELPHSAYGLSYFADGAKHSYGKVTVWAEIGTNTYTLFKGRVISIISNPKERQGIIRVTVGEDKYYNDRPVGVSCNVHCSRLFGQGGCTVTPLSKTVAINAIGNLLISANSNATSSDGLYVRGYVEYKGVRITIRNWKEGTPIIQLSAQPPASWQGKVVTLKSGCIGDIETCRKYSNELQFLGLGIEMVPYSPTMEMK